MARSNRTSLLSTAPLSGAWLSMTALVLRLSAGLAMLTHGIPKLMAFGSLHSTFADPLGIGSTFSLVMAIGAEVGCSVLLIFGLITRLSTLPLLFTMCIAFFVIQGGAPFATRELAALYIAIYVAILGLGSGKISLDYVIFKK